MKRKTVKRSEIRKHVRYEQSTGIFYSKEHGNVLGEIGNDGYLYVWAGAVKYKADELAWYYMHGWWAKHGIIHLDEIKLNCWLSNLRPLKKIRRINNATGVTGVYLDKATGKWLAFIGVDGKKKNLGLFRSFDRAVIARYRGEESVGRNLCTSAYYYFHKHRLYNMEGTPIKEDVITPSVDNNEHSHVKVLGVDWCEDGNWRVSIPVENKVKTIGNYKNFDMAVVARWKAEQKREMGDDTPAAIHVRAYALKNLKVKSDKKNKIRKSNKTGIPGVHWDNRSGRYKATLYVNGKQECFGLFKTLEQAIVARYRGEQAAGVAAGTPAQLYVQNMFI